MKPINTRLVDAYVNEQIVKCLKKNTLDNLAVGCLRYEALRKLNVRQFGELFERNIREGIPFDTLVDELIWENGE